MDDQEMLRQAKELANSLKNIKEIQCPRDIINPGLYFGFILGYLAAKETVEREEQNG